MIPYVGINAQVIQFYRTRVFIFLAGLDWGKKDSLLMFRIVFLLGGSGVSWGQPLGRPHAGESTKPPGGVPGDGFRVLNGLGPPGSIRRSSVLAGRSWDSITKADAHGRSPVDGV